MSWEMVKLGDVCKTSAGGTPLKLRKEYYEDGTIPWLMSGEVCKKDIFTSVNHITNAGVENSSAKVFPVNTTLVAMYGATAGQVGILRFPAATNQAVCGILPNDNYLPEFLYYYFTYYKEILLLEASGVAQPNLSQIKIKNVPIPKISIQFQQKIVAKLDAIFSEIDKATVSAEANAKNAILLIKATITKLIKDFGEERFVKFGDICGFVRGPFGGSLKKSIFVDSGIAVYEQQHPINNQFDSFRYFITEDKFAEMKRFEVFPHDLLMSCSGVTLGKIAIVPKDSPRGIINQALLKITPKNVIRKDFLKIIMESDYFQSILWDVSGGAAQPNVPSVKVIKDFLIPLPALNEQDEFIDIISKILSYDFKLIYKKKKNSLLSLKQSTLHEAFNGELVKD